MLEKRKLIIGTYDTARDGPWTLAELEFPEPEPQENLVDIPGKDGPLDLSTALTNGETRFNARELQALLECSDGTRDDRLRQVRDIINQLHGRRLQIILPDDPDHYVEGRVTVRQQYNDLVHAAVAVTAKCDPWRYSRTESSIQVTCSRAGVETVLPNGGRREVTPSVTVTGRKAAVTLTDGVYTWTLEEGTYTLVDLVLPGYSRKAITCKGAGVVTFNYREAVL